MELKGNIIDLENRTLFYGAVVLEGEMIKAVRWEKEATAKGPYILPGFIDSHIHIESSMLVPSEFARLAVLHGTVATVSDPHEIANVMGMEGVRYMIGNGKKVPFKFNFGAPSCVPATSFESAGAVLGVEEVQTLLEDPDILYLSEMMNYPGVLFKDKDVMAKIKAAHALGKPVDGHAPGLQGEDARKYIAAGISTDHECFTYEEGLEKLEAGMKVIIREGSAAKNFEALIPLIEKYPEKIMFCSDDKHPDDLILGHINQLVSRAIKKGYDLFDVLRAACWNPVDHYNLPVGRLRVDDPADLIIVGDLKDFKVHKTFINGKLVAENGESFLKRVEAKVINNFNVREKSPEDFQIAATSSKVKVIKALNGELITDQVEAEVKVQGGMAISDPERDILKMTVVNRYQEAKPAVAFINGFGIQSGAIASCVGHDSHNIIAVGVDDDAICRAVNAVVREKGGIVAVSESREMVLPLPVAGIMTTKDGWQVGKDYAQIDRFTKEELGSQLDAPFMTLSFMALLVIPDLKLSDKGLFEGKSFQFTDLFIYTDEE